MWKLHFPEGNQYQGGWSEGKPNGFGIMVFFGNKTILTNNTSWRQEGAYYVGLFKNGKMHGTGTIYEKIGNMAFSGKFEQGGCYKGSDLLIPTEGCNSYLTDLTNPPP